MKHRLLLVFLFSLCIGAWLGLAGCQKASPLPKHIVKPPPDSLPQVIKDIGYFKPGSYWIYQDSASGKLDSVWVVRSDSSWRHTYVYVGDQEVIETDFRSSLGYGWDLYAHGTNEKIQGLFREAFTSTSGLFAWPYEEGKNYGNPHTRQNDTVLMGPKLESATLPIGAIGPIYQCITNSEIRTGYTHATIWTSPHYGVVRQWFHYEAGDLHSNEGNLIAGDWKLLRCHIVQ